MHLGVWLILDFMYNVQQCGLGAQPQGQADLNPDAPTNALEKAFHFSSSQFLHPWNEDEDTGLRKFSMILLKRLTWCSFGVELMVLSSSLSFPWHCLMFFYRVISYSSDFSDRIPDFSQRSNDTDQFNPIGRHFLLFFSKIQIVIPRNHWSFLLIGSNHNFYQVFFSINKSQT